MISIQTSIPLFWKVERHRPKNQLSRDVQKLPPQATSDRFQVSCSLASLQSTKSRWTMLAGHQISLACRLWVSPNASTPVSVVREVIPSIALSQTMELRKTLNLFTLAIRPKVPATTPALWLENLPRIASSINHWIVFLSSFRSNSIWISF